MDLMDMMWSLIKWGSFVAVIWYIVEKYTND